jgi:hypothetical protein
MKTTETTEEVSSRRVEKRAEMHKCQRNAPFAREKWRVDWKKGLQTGGEGRKSRKSPTLVVGKKPNGNVSKMILLFDIGNTNTHVGLATGRRVVKQTDVPTASWFNGTAAKLVRKFAGHATLYGAVLCSVVPRATPEVREFIAQLGAPSTGSA